MSEKSNTHMCKSHPYRVISPGFVQQSYATRSKRPLGVRCTLPPDGSKVYSARKWCDIPFPPPRNPKVASRYFATAILQPVLLSLLLLTTDSEKYQAIKQKVRISWSINMVVLFCKWHLSLNPMTVFHPAPVLRYVYSFTTSVQSLPAATCWRVFLLAVKSKEIYFVFLVLNGRKLALHQAATKHDIYSYT